METQHIIIGIITLIVSGIITLEREKREEKKKGSKKINNNWILQWAKNHHADMGNPGQLHNIQHLIQEKFPWISLVKDYIANNQVEIIHDSEVPSVPESYHIGKEGSEKDKNHLIFLIQKGKEDLEKVEDELSKIKKEEFDEKESLNDIIDPNVIEWLQDEVYPYLQIVKLFKFG